MPEPVVEIAGLVKDYRGLRPLRVEQLTIHRGDRVAIVGMDGPAAEIFVNLLTGVTLPDRGRIAIFGRSTADIVDSADWLTVVDRFGIVSERAVLLDQLTVEQNLAMPFTLEIDPLADDVRSKAAALASEVGLDERQWREPVAVSSASARAQIRLGRALALAPEVLLFEHINASLDSDDAIRFGAEAGVVAERRGVALVALTRDPAFARAIAPIVLRWQPSSGRLQDSRGWLGRLLG